MIAVDPDDEGHPMFFVLEHLQKSPDRENIYLNVDLNTLLKFCANKIFSQHRFSLIKTRTRVLIYCICFFICLF